MKPKKPKFVKAWLESCQLIAMEEGWCLQPATNEDQEKRFYVFALTPMSPFESIEDLKKYLNTKRNLMYSGAIDIVNSRIPEYKVRLLGCKTEKPADAKVEDFARWIADNFVVQKTNKALSQNDIIKLAREFENRSECCFCQQKACDGCQTSL